MKRREGGGEGRGAMSGRREGGGEGRGAMLERSPSLLSLEPTVSFYILGELWKRGMVAINCIPEYHDCPPAKIGLGA